MVVIYYKEYDYKYQLFVMMLMVTVRSRRSRDSTAAGGGNSLVVCNVARGTLRGSDLPLYHVCIILLYNILCRVDVVHLKSYFC